MAEYLFSYGTLQQEKTQLQLFGRLLNGTADQLPGFAIRELVITDETFLARGEDAVQRVVSPSSGSHNMIAGTALELTPEELQIADQYEPPGYSRAKVTLSSGKEAWIYVADQ